MQGEGLGRVALDGLQQGPLVPTARNPQVDLAAAGGTEQRGHGSRVRREHRDEHLSRDLVGGAGTGEPAGCGRAGRGSGRGGGL